jgi:hypothetical protein
MELTLTEKEMDSILSALRLGGNPTLYQKLKIANDLMKKGLPYKKILREQYGYVI